MRRVRARSPSRATRHLRRTATGVNRRGPVVRLLDRRDVLGVAHLGERRLARGHRSRLGRRRDAARARAGACDRLLWRGLAAADSRPCASAFAWSRSTSAATATATSPIGRTRGRTSRRTSPGSSTRSALREVYAVGTRRVAPRLRAWRRSIRAASRAPCCSTRCWSRAAAAGVEPPNNHSRRRRPAQAHGLGQPGTDDRPRSPRGHRSTVWRRDFLEAYVEGGTLRARRRPHRAQVSRRDRGARLRGGGASRRASTYLPLVDVPTLLVSGAESPTLPPERARQAAALLRHGRLEILPGRRPLRPDGGARRGGAPARRVSGVRGDGCCGPSRWRALATGASLSSPRVKGSLERAPDSATGLGRGFRRRGSGAARGSGSAGRLHDESWPGGEA